MTLDKIALRVVNIFNGVVAPIALQISCVLLVIKSAQIPPIGFNLKLSG